MLAELPVERLRRVCYPEETGCDTSEAIEPLEAIVGQARAVRSLHFGLAINSSGFNIFVAGMPGTGRTTAVQRFLSEIASKQPVPDDWVYVNNFKDAYYPRALRLPPGRGAALRDGMKSLVEGASAAIKRAFESEDYANRREETIRVFQKQRDEVFAYINSLAERAGFVIQSTPAGLLTIPVVQGKPLSREDFLALPQQAKDEINQRQEALQAEVQASLRQLRAVEKAAEEAMEKLDKQVALFALGPLLEDLKDHFQSQPEVLAYLDEVRDDMLANLDQFRAEPGQAQPASPFRIPGMEERSTRKYEVNVLVDNSDLKGAPVVMERNPTYNYLFGRLEKEAQFGALLTDFTLIKQGSLHKANGGYLVLPVEEVLRNPLSWDSLKRALRSRQITIEEPGERLGFLTTKGLRPEPIPLDVKVILIGQEYIYQLLYALDEDFRELFKVKADFDIAMDRDEHSVRDYAAFVSNVVKEENLKHLDASAMAKIVEHGSRLADDQKKLSTRFGEISDIIREASFYAAQENAPFVTDAHVKKAIDERFYRSNLIQERIVEAIQRNIIMIDTSGAKVGQVNGLAVLGLGDVMFGQPSRITASIALGREGIIDIERESKLGGPIHTKGMLILSGFLASRYAIDKPLTLSARLVFEQSYSGVDGDSASSTELYALLSALSGVPIKQSFAVTGSVNQKGEVQPIGGANEKIEGYFAVCKAKGLQGDESVLIPAANVDNLMLKEEILDAVREGKFHIYAVANVDEGIELLTGVKAGKRLEDGSWEEGSINFLVDRTLQQMAERMRDFGAPPAKPERTDQPEGQQPPEKKL
jgi:lon-related putative ATP-dependent protease